MGTGLPSWHPRMEIQAYLSWVYKDPWMQGQGYIAGFFSQANRHPMMNKQGCLIGVSSQVYKEPKQRQVT